MPGPPETAEPAETAATTEPAETAAPESRTALADRLRSRRAKRSLLERVSIQSKLMLMLVTTIILATAVTGGIGFESGRSSLRAEVFERLTGIRQAQARVMELGLQDISGSLVTFSHGQTVAEALEAFNVGFNKLSDATITPAQNKSIIDFYNQRFTDTGDSRLDVSALLPTSAAARYLQANYTVPIQSASAAGDRTGDPAGDAAADPAKSTEKAAESPPENAAGKAGNATALIDDAGENAVENGAGRAWSAANERYNGYFAEIVARMGFQDALLVNTEGDVVYSTKKGVELGINILTGPYRGQGNLPDAFRKAMTSIDTDYVDITDFAEYLPAGQPTAWMLVPVGPPGRASGVMVVQYPSSIITGLVTDNRGWEQAGMGRTGETFLVGDDDLMRSDSRLFLTDQDAYRRDVIANGTPAATADRAIKQGTTVLIQPVGTKAADAAQRGQTGTLIATDYLGRRALQAYAPLSLNGLDWVIVSSINSEEAFAPERNFTQRLVRSTAIIIFITCLAAMVWSRLFVRPIKRLETGVQQISTGDYNVSVPVNSKDEFGDLTVAFNEMSRTLAVKDQLLTEQRQENDKLLRSLMPQNIADRYRGGEETIAAGHQDATVIFADLIGLDEIAGGLDPEPSLEIINKLVRQFDAAAETHGVERVRNTHNGYLASCGLTVPRLDNINRTVSFAADMQHIVNRFNTETGNRIQLRAGIDTGTITSGLVGRAGLVYDLWGRAVQVASRMRSGTTQPGVYVTEKVYEATRDTWPYTAGGTITVGEGQQPTWRLAEDSQ